MKKLSKTVRLLLYAALVLPMASCGLDFDVDDTLANVAAKMSLPYDTVYAMRGDTLSLRPLFTPDSVNTRDVLITTSAPDVVSVDPITGHIEAVGSGWAKIYAQSVSARLQDSCAVCVMEPWVSTVSYPYETIFYATVTVGGKPLAANMTVAAFVGGECRGVAMPQTFHGVAFSLFRVGTEKWPDNLNPNIPDDPEIPGDDEEEAAAPVRRSSAATAAAPVRRGFAAAAADSADDLEVLREKIEFRCYDPTEYHLYICPQRIVFDGETYGTLSNLYKIEF